MEKMTGMSRAQVTRLIGRYKASGRVGVKVYRRHRFAQRYTLADVELLAAVDEAHETLSGPATRRFWSASISSTASRSMRGWPRSRSPTYTTCASTAAIGERRLNYIKTKPTAVTIAERRPPDPQGRPGYLRVDTVHQGDQNGVKGVFHINAVDEVTQWQIVAATRVFPKLGYSRF